jgi:hypothetical protein
VLAIVARSLLVILIACCLAGIERVRRNDDLTVLFLMDRSYSVQAMQQYQEEFIHDAAATMHSEDRLGLIDFARNAFLATSPPGRALPVMPDTERTDVASAVHGWRWPCSPMHGKRILMSDGNDNMGDVLSKPTAQADASPSTSSPRYEHRNGSTSAHDRPAAEPGEQVTCMVIGTYRRASGALTIHHNDRLVEMPRNGRT